jgi:mutual gliding-motility protein MglA
MEENVESWKNLCDNLSLQNQLIDDVPCVLEYNKRDLPNVAPVNYMEYVMNNRKKRLQSFEVISSTGQNVFAALNAVSQILLHKFSKQSEAPQGAPLPVAIPVEPGSSEKQKLPA